MRGRGRIELAETPDGGVSLEVVTRKPLDGLESRSSLEIPYDPVAHGYARLDASGVPTHSGEWGDAAPGWRYIHVHALVANRPIAQVTRYLDLSAGSDERRFAGKIVEQGMVRFVWVNEDAEVLVELAEPWRTSWSQALDATRDVDHASWRSELAAIEWKQSRVSSWRETPPLEHRPRIAVPPDAPVPYFAARSGDIPAEESPTIADVRLPPGTRCGAMHAAYWATFDDVDEPSKLASQLAAAFPQTGLWPLGWGWDGEDPDSYFEGHGDLEAIGTRPAGEILRAAWEEYERDPEVTEPFGPDFPGLAQGSASAAMPADPFGVLDYPLPWGTRGRQLLLVPCNRPADALAVLGLLGLTHQTSDICTVLRSWEERFAVVPVDLSPSLTTFAVGAPPTTTEQALRLAAEICAIANFDESVEPGAIRRLAACLVPGQQSARPLDSSLTPHTWQFNLDD